MIKAVLFDAFGTLFDTGNGSIKATFDIFNKFNLDTNAKEIYKEWKVIHKRITYNLEYFINEKDIFIRGLSELYRKYSIISDPNKDIIPMLNSLEKRKIFNDVNTCLNELNKRDIKIIIASNTDTDPIYKNIIFNKLKFNKLFTSEVLKCYKPDPLFFSLILNNLKLNTNDVVFIGDSVLDDVIGPTKIGIKSFWLNRNNENHIFKKEKPYKIIKSLSELNKYI